MNGYSETEHGKATDRIARDAGIAGTGFTPGPWAAERCGRWKRYAYIRSAHGKQVGYAYEDIRLFRSGEAEANAHLIAAAPDLYEIATRWLDQGDGIIAKGCPIGQLIEDTRAALSLARGEVTR